jgi:hypothetical protein
VTVYPGAKGEVSVPIPVTGDIRYEAFWRADVVVNKDEIGAVFHATAYELLSL